MGIIISCDTIIVDGKLPPLNVTLICDNRSAMFCRGSTTFTSPDGYVGAHAEAMNAGWMERQSPRGRLWLCGECSGKHARP